MKQEFSVVSNNENSRISPKDFLTVKFICIVLFLLWQAVPPNHAFSLLMSSGVVFFVALTSSFLLISYVIKYIFTKKPRKSYLVKMVKFLIFIAISILCFFFLKSIENQAKEKLWSEAVKIQAQCLSMKKCPEYPASWKKDEADGKDYTLYEYKTDTDTIFYFRYYLKSDDHFRIYISYGPDMKYCLDGGIDIPIARISCL